MTNKPTDPLIDLSDLLPPEMQEDARKRLARKSRTGKTIPPVQQKVVAKALRSTPFRDKTYDRALRLQAEFRGLDKPQHPTQASPVLAEQVAFYDIFTCRCSNTWYAPRAQFMHGDNSSIWDHIIDTKHKSHYTQAATLNDSVPRRVEFHTIKVPCCPECINSRDDFIDPCAKSMMRIKGQPQPGEQFGLDFFDPDFGFLYPASKYPLAVAGELQEGIL